MSVPDLKHIAEEFATAQGFVVQTFCGKGAFKETFRIEYPDGSTAALKLVDRSKISEVRTDREIEALRRCQTPRIAKLLARQTLNATDGKIYDVVIEEFLDGGTLEDKLKIGNLSDQEVIGLTIGLFEALAVLHPLKLVHRDIKPANIMFRLNSKEPVLVDFGLVRDLSQTSITMTWLPQGPGTPFYAPPEQLNNEKALIDWRADQFAIGVLAVEILIGRHPYQMKTMSSSEAIFAVSERRLIDPDILSQLQQRNLAVFAKMLRPWPIQRFSNIGSLLKVLREIIP